MLSILRAIRLWLSTLLSRGSGKRVTNRALQVMTSDDAYKAAEDALHRLELLVEYNKEVNMRSRELLARARAMSALTQSQTRP